jgi:hypothetical protein
MVVRQAVGRFDFWKNERAPTGRHGVYVSRTDAEA